MQRVHVVLSCCLLLFLSTASPLSAQSSISDTLREVQRKIDLLTEELEKMKLGEVAEPRYEAARGLGPAAAKVYHLKKSGVSIAGYGEAVYENYARQFDNGVTAGKKPQLDFLRNIIYVGYRFNDWILFNSEIEFEHGSTGKVDSKGKAIGEVSVEFGYVELMFSSQINLRAGMVLVPVGIVNEKHEPTTFFGVLRPQVERSIVPTTWRTSGFGFYGEIVPDLQYRAYLVEGLNAANFAAADGLRGGRQNSAKSVAEDFALTGKLEYTGVPGAVFGTSFYAGRSGQGAGDSLGGITAGTALLTLQAEYAWQGLEMRSLLGYVTLDQADRVSKLAGSTIGSSMFGWYGTAGYDLLPRLFPGTEHYLAPYVQYEKLDTHNSVAGVTKANAALSRSILTLGLMYKPHPNVGFKMDFSDHKNVAGSGLNQWNVALNYMY